MIKKVYFLAVLATVGCQAYEFTGIPLEQKSNTIVNEQEIIDPEPGLSNIIISTQTENIGPSIKHQAGPTLPLDDPEKLIPYSRVTPSGTAPYPLEKRYTE